MTTSMENINLADLSSQEPKIKYGCAKNLLAIAKDSPEELYPYVDYFVELLNSENKILKWTAIDVLGSFAKTDEGRKLDEVIKKIYGFLSCGNLITATHAIAALANIAASRPDLQEEITEELLKVEHYEFDTDECCNIAFGKVIVAFGTYLKETMVNEEVVAFVRKQTENTRPATARKAREFLKRIGPPDA